MSFLTVNMVLPFLRELGLRPGLEVRHRRYPLALAGPGGTLLGLIFMMRGGGGDAGGVDRTDSGVLGPHAGGRRR